jgi:cysteine desulfurase
MKRVYLDYAATTPIHPEVVKEMLPFLTDSFGNPSSVYSFGKEARTAVDEARNKVAVLIGAQADEIVFTGSGSEADNLAIKGVALANRSRGNHIITSCIEHHAVLEACKFLEEENFRISYLPVDTLGRVSISQLKEAVTGQTILISIMHANNEIGTIQPISEIGRLAREDGIYFHTDAVQTLGHLPVNVNDLKVDLLSASAHKFYGPKGVGFLYLRKGTRLTPLIHGGEQEKGRRASTENVAGIVGLGKAVELAGREIEQEAVRLTALRQRLISGLLASLGNVHLNGDPEARLPNNVNIRLAYLDGENLVLNLDREGICISTRSACSSNSQTSSHVLQAIGLQPEEAYGSVRLTLGKWTTEEDIERVLAVMPQTVARLREMSPLYLKNRGN